MKPVQLLKMSRFAILILMMGISAAISSTAMDPHDYHAVPVQRQKLQAHAKELVGAAPWLKEALARHTARDTREAVRAIVSKSLKEQDQHLAAPTTKAILTATYNVGMDPLFVLALMKTESRFNPHVVGRHGEVGLMQILPETAQWIAKRNKIPWLGVQALHNPVYNIHLGVAYLHYLRQSFGADSAAYVAAYNMGAANVRRLRKSKINPRIYAAKVLTNYREYYLSLNSAQEQTLVSHSSILPKLALHL